MSCGKFDNKNTKITLKIFSIVLILLSGFFVLFGKASADERGIVISEIMYDVSGGDTKKEWIEIYNASKDIVKIEKRKMGLIDEKEERNTEGGLENTCHTFKDDLVIDSGEFVVIADNSDEFAKIYPGFEGKIIDSYLNLQNDAGEIKISFDKCETWEDEIEYKKESGANGNGKTLEKINLEEKFNFSNWQESYINGGTPGEKISEKPKPKEYSKKIRLNEIFPDPSTSPEKDNEFVELHNFDDKDIDLEGWKIFDESGNEFEFSGKIDAEEREVFYDTVSLNNSGDTVYLKNPNDEVVDEVNYEKAKEDFSYSFDGEGWIWTSVETPGKENEFDKEKDKDWGKDIIITEILPNPSGDEKTGEYIELFNREKSAVNLNGWSLKDSFKSAKPFLIGEGAVIGSRKYSVFYRNDFGFALNNSGGETVYLIDPKGEIIYQVRYEGSAKEGISYNFNGLDWHWSGFLTPGKENKFNKVPKVKLDVDKHVYKNMYAGFSVDVDDPENEKIKITWDFGDGHRSYLQKTRHRYEEKGIFSASVKVSDSGTEVIKKFKVKVKKFPEYEVRIIQIMPNPEGNDSQAEWIMLENRDKKDVNLEGWSVASGWDKPSNHPISGKFVIKAGKSKTLTREFSRFTLNNKKSKIELRYPNGKTAHKVKYVREDGIGEGEVYEKTKGTGWEWKVPETALTSEIIASDQKREMPDKNAPIFQNEDIKGKATAYLRKNRLNSLVNYGTSIEYSPDPGNGQGRVLGVMIKRDADGRETYLFNHSSGKREHYAVKFSKKIVAKINSYFNKIISKT